MERLKCKMKYLLREFHPFTWQPTQTNTGHIHQQQSHQQTMLVTMLDIRDILVRIRIRGSVYLWLMDPDPDPAPDPIPFLCGFQDAKNYVFFIVFSNYLPSGILSSVLKGPKTCGSCGSGSRSPTLINNQSDRSPYDNVSCQSDQNHHMAIKNTPTAVRLTLSINNIH